MHELPARAEIRSETGRDPGARAPDVEFEMSALAVTLAETLDAADKLCARINAVLCFEADVPPTTATAPVEPPRSPLGSSLRDRREQAEMTLLLLTDATRRLEL